MIISPDQGYWLGWIAMFSVGAVVLFVVNVASLRVNDWLRRRRASRWREPWD